MQGYTKETNILARPSRAKGTDICLFFRLTKTLIQSTTIAWYNLQCSRCNALPKGPRTGPQGLPQGPGTLLPQIKNYCFLGILGAQNNKEFEVTETSEIHYFLPFFVSFYGTTKISSPPAVKELPTILKMLLCNDCGASFETPKNLEEHGKIYHDDQKRTCKLCKKKNCWAQNSP